MHRMIGSIFKVLMISIILMIVMDVTFNVLDIITVHRRVDALSVVIRQELEENDSIPSSISGTFQNELNSIVSHSSVAYQIDWNLDTTLTDKNGNSEPPIDQASVNSGNVNYGDQLHLVIKVGMAPHSVMFFGSPSQHGGSFLGNSIFKYTDTYSWTVPALRYLK